MPRNSTAPGLALVNWPAPSAPFKDTGEGGMFAYAVWEHRDDLWDRCHVEQILTVSMWDVMVGAHGPMAEEFEETLKDWTAAFNAGQAPHTVLMPTLGAAIHLGSTAVSLFDDSTRSYFTVQDVTDLSPAARPLLDALEGTYGPATFLTFLDT